MSVRGRFYGIGVGPGPSGFLPVAALDALRRSDVILTPKARSAKISVARQCLAGIDIPEEKYVEFLYNMDKDRTLLHGTYGRLAKEIVALLCEGKTIAYVTIGDSMTYSTYSYLLEALLQLVPDLEHQTFPGITSYAAAASALNWPLGQGSERILIAPCPESMEQLRSDIEAHDIVILMKISHRLPAVLALLDDMGISELCALANRIGLPGEQLFPRADQVDLTDDKLGYLSTMLIRKMRAGRPRSQYSAGDV